MIKIESKFFKPFKGAFKDQKGHWDLSCLHFDVRNYTLEAWTGYYKSVRSCMYCDGSFGPLMVRRELLPQIKKLKLKPERLSLADRLIMFVANPTWRVIACPDCMFYVKSRLPLTRSQLLLVARRLYLNRVVLNGKSFSFTCPEIGHDCNIQNVRKWAYSPGGTLVPPCCQQVHSAMILGTKRFFSIFNGLIQRLE